MLEYRPSCEAINNVQAGRQHEKYAWTETRIRPTAARFISSIRIDVILRDCSPFVFGNAGQRSYAH